MISIKRKTFVLIISYLCAAVLALGGYSLAAYVNGTAYSNTAKNGYSHAFGEVVSAVNDLDATLKKASLSTGIAMTETVCARAYGDCLAAQMTMAALPFSTAELERTAAFLNKAGDFAAALCRTAPEKNGLTDSERQSVAELSKTASAMAAQLTELQSDVESGAVIMDDPENAVRGRSAEYKNAAKLSAVMLGYEKDAGADTKLEYDGQYGAAAVTIKQGDLIDETTAKKKAAKFLGLEEERLKLKAVSQGGDIYFYYDVLLPDTEAELVLTGDGRAKSFSSSRIVYTEGMGIDEARDAAAKFLAYRGYGNMTAVSSKKSGGIAAFEFAAVQNGAKCLMDTVKIAIACDNGGLYSFDASGYLSYNKARTRPTRLISAAAAEKALPGSVSAGEGALAVILSPGGSEKWCWEFACTDKNGGGSLIYVDALTGNQREIVLK